MEIPGVKRIVREMCGVVRGRRDGVAVWINRGPPPIAKEFEDCWDLVVTGDCDEVAHRANMRRWNDEGNDYKECTESEAERAKQKGNEVKVIVKTARSKSHTPRGSVTPKKSSTPALMMTPAESPKLKVMKLPNIPFKFAPPDKKAKALKTGAQKSTTTKTGSKTTKPSFKTTTSSKNSMQPGQENIKGAFKVIKLNSAKSKSFKSDPTTPKKDRNSKPVKTHHPSPTGPEKARRLLDSIGEPHPMAPLSPNSIKSNGPLSPPESDFPPLKLERVEVPLRIEVSKESDPPRDDQRLKRMSEEILSPTGKAPSDMLKLLN